MQQRWGLYDPKQEHDACGVGFLADLGGSPTHRIVEQGLEILQNLEHRGARGSDDSSGDGAGMLVRIPDGFFRDATAGGLPEAGKYGVMMLFLPSGSERRRRAEKLIENTVEGSGFRIICWRDVPVEPEVLGTIARSSMPKIRQIFIAGREENEEEAELEFYLLRKRVEQTAYQNGFRIEELYPVSCSSRTIVYKGMFLAGQFSAFYPDLSSPDFISDLAMVHQRYSTNTFPSWPLAQPFRYLAHNGEINTISRNSSSMKARERHLDSPRFGSRKEDLLPVVTEGISDSAVLDNVFELLVQGGRSLEHAMMMMIPEPFGTKYHISEDKRAFYEYHAAFMEPWDGPAAVTFTDGLRIGAALDRNGLRPLRYTVCRDGLVVAASETGVLDIPPEQIRETGRLSPGKMIMADLERGRFIRDREIKSLVSRRRPYRRWLEEEKIELKGLFQLSTAAENSSENLRREQLLMGYSREDLEQIIIPMVDAAQEPLGSMGNDEQPAVRSSSPVVFYDYFHQLFAQVTNPPIDPYRESLVMSLMSFVGREGNLLDETPEHCRQLKLAHPILTNEDIARLKGSQSADFSAAGLPMLFKAGKGSLAAEVERLCRSAEAAIDGGASLIILSDRGSDPENAPIPALLAVGAVHHYLVRAGKRHQAGLIVETGEAREVHHIACLIGYGASAVNPCLALETIADLQKQRRFQGDLDPEDAVDRYINALKKGLLKVLSKMGVSTIRSYRGAQLYEALGLKQSFVDRYFTGTSTRIGGIGIDEVEASVLERHRRAFPSGVLEKEGGREQDPLPAADDSIPALESGGRYQYRKGESRHLLSPQAVVLFHQAVRKNDREAFQAYCDDVDKAGREGCTIRGLFELGERKHPLPLEEVEPAESVMKRFVTSAMSYGSISPEAHETIAEAMNRIGGASNCGEGGEAVERYMSKEGPDRNSRIKQIASARFGVNSAYLVSAGELQIKMAQGAKPGEGGQLPGHKVGEIIAAIRNSTPGVGLISPPPHHDIYSIEDLAQLIFDLKNANDRARVSVKLVSEVGVGTIAAGVAKGGADMVLISGYDGGTGSSPLSSIKYAGTAWELGLAETQQTLVLNGLRSRIRVQTDGQVRTARDVVIAALLGAEEFGFATSVLLSLGCVMMRKCHLNTCPVGVATQDPELRKRFRGKPEHLINFFRLLAGEVREYMARLGFRYFEDMVGRVDLIDGGEAIEHYREKGLDFSRLLQSPENPAGTSLRAGDDRPAAGGTGAGRVDFSGTLDADILSEIAEPFGLEGMESEGAGKDSAAGFAETAEAIKSGRRQEAPAHSSGRPKPVELKRSIRNSNRSVGALLSSRISRTYGPAGLPDDSVQIDFTGTAGQSFGAFLASGLTFRLFGPANDYPGKGLSGGRIIIRPPAGTPYLPHLNTIAGNVGLYGATAGELFINGIAGERFAVRNSGALAVVEGVGDHGCEYMTGGRVVVLGDTGVNFAAGMSGGIAYILDRSQLFDTRCNLELIDVEPVAGEQDERFLLDCVRRHQAYTESPLAAEILSYWEEMLPLFVKVIPLEYRKALERMQEREYESSDRMEMAEEVFG